MFKRKTTLLPFKVSKWFYRCSGHTERAVEVILLNYFGKLDFANLFELRT